MKKLSKEEMKHIMGGVYEGDKGDGDCQERGNVCNSGTALNCCSGLVCAEFECQIKTR